MRALTVAIVVALAGCPAPDNSHGLVTTAPPAQLLDYNEFVCEVQPVLIRHCSFLGCHGNAEHGLRIYSPGKLRLDDSAVTRAARDALLSETEIIRNFESATGTVYFAQPADRTSPTPTDRVPLLSKPTRASFGGAEHHGVGIFPTGMFTLDTDPEYLLLAAWVAGKKATGKEMACADMFTKLGIMPK